MKQLDKLKLPGSAAGLSKEATKHCRAVMKQLDKLEWSKRQKTRYATTKLGKKLEEYSVDP